MLDMILKLGPICNTIALGSKEGRVAFLPSARRMFSRSKYSYWSKVNVTLRPSVSYGSCQYTISGFFHILTKYV